MADIYLALALMAALTAALFATGRLVGRVVPTWGCSLLVAVAVGAMFAYTYFLWCNVALARLLPFSSLVIVGNWFPLVAGLVAGLVWSKGPGGRLRRGASTAALLGAGIYATVSPLLGSAPQCGDRWTGDGLCLQTTPHTCTPASAATLLRLHGIEASEAEMAELCLTRRGTTWQGLYRGLKRKTAGTPWEVEVVACDADELLSQPRGPLVLMVGLEEGRDAAAMRDEQGWIPGVGHSVVLLDVRRGQVEIADPSPAIQRECWTAANFQRLWRNCGMRLVRR
jgi:hypothetical protein